MHISVLFKLNCLSEKSTTKQSIVFVIDTVNCLKHSHDFLSFSYFLGSWEMINRCQFNLCIQKFSFSMVVESFLSFLVKPNLLVHKLSRSQNITSHLNISTGCRIMSVKKRVMSLEDCFTTELIASVPKCFKSQKTVDVLISFKRSFVSILKFKSEIHLATSFLPGNPSGL